MVSQWDILWLMMSLMDSCHVLTKDQIGTNLPFSTNIWHKCKALMPSKETSTFRTFRIPGCVNYLVERGIYLEVWYQYWTNEQMPWWEMTIWHNPFNWYGNLKKNAIALIVEIIISRSITCVGTGYVRLFERVA